MSNNSFPKIPDENYVLCGRGAKNYNHKGNIRFRQLVESNVPLYIKSSQKMKSSVIDNVIREIQSEDLVFVECNAIDSCWSELSRTASRKKVSHRFRDFVRKESQIKLIDRISSTTDDDFEFQTILSQVMENALAEPKAEPVSKHCSLSVNKIKNEFEPVSLNGSLMEVFAC
mmetsp:Transcript_20662/g.31065  ORF Transcript_20662/g.31065 Transcript_20662/m.31065 type:complete len:172 (-) Transcript_20662:972-1487(-)